MASYRGDLSGLGHYMQDCAPDVYDSTLMALGELLEEIGSSYEPDPIQNAALVHAAYRVGVTWMLNQGRAK